MAGSDPGSAREEAERLVAAVIAAVRLATAGAGTGPGGTAPGDGYGPFGGILSTLLGHRGGLATGSAECQVCPICRAISVLRDPSPEVAERVAAGAGDLAVGVASLMRAFATVSGAARAAGGDGAAAGAAGGDGAAAGAAGGDDPTSGADRGHDPTFGQAAGVGREGDGWQRVMRTGHDLWSAPEPERDVWSVATRSEAARSEAARSGGSAGTAADRTGAVPTSRTAAEEVAAGSGDVPGDGP